MRPRQQSKGAMSRDAGFVGGYFRVVVASCTSGRALCITAAPTVPPRRSQLRENSHAVASPFGVVELLSAFSLNCGRPFRTERIEIRLGTIIAKT
jgi:hypothetical protein